MWFRKKQSSADEIAPVNPERLARSLERIGWNFEQMEDGNCRAFFDGFATVFEIGQATVSVYMWSTSYYDDGDRYPEAMQWANQWNYDSVFGTARPYVDDDGDLMMRVDTSFLTEVGVTDAQLDDYLKCGVSCTGQAIEKYIKDLDIESQSPDDDED